ncbi:hypothetical protein [Longirhabdus pacifica]|uniref:hypothetical protein n=1 Tax=Longirhabdus pacifica TaxID=2305227 RepID=UPI00100916DD|nr:hypothetical protein [Longirhabdus pacifica]
MLKSSFGLIIFIVLITGCVEENESQNWQESSIFTSEIATMIGEEGRIGVRYDDTEFGRFYANEEAFKRMWHLWGDEDELNEKLKVIGTHESGGDPITLVSGIVIGSPNNGADGHTISSLLFPQSGMWKLDAYTGESLFGTIFVRVHD